MRNSPIEHPSEGRFVVLRSEYVELTEHGAAAAVLAAIEHWVRFKRDRNEYEDDGAADLSVVLSMKQLEKDVCGAFKRRAIERGIEILLELGFISRERCEGFDRKFVYWLHVPVVNAAIAMWRKRHMDAAETPSEGAKTPLLTRASEPQFSQEPEQEPQPRARSVESESTAEVWRFYVQTFGTRSELNDTRRRIIRNALKTRDVDTCKRAIVGLSKSPWHNGENPGATKYLDIRYALKGNQRDGESNDERIDKMAELASSPSPAPVRSSVLQGQIDARKDELRRIDERDAQGRERLENFLRRNGIRTAWRPDGHGGELPTFTETGA